MIYYIKKMTKMTMKLLLRNKGFLFFAVLLPIVATLIMNLNGTSDAEVKESGITRLSSVEEPVAYLNDYMLFSVKVYDSSDSQVGISFMEDLAKEGLFQIYGINTSDLTKEERLESAKESALTDNAGAILMLNEDFASKILEGTIADSVELYSTGDDERYDILASAVELLATEYISVAKDVASEEELLEKIKDYEAKTYSVETKEYAMETEETLSLLDIDYEKTHAVGYTLAVLSLAFLFSGILILSTIIKERQNLVYTRITLTKADSVSYMLSKFLVVLIVTLTETIFVGISYTLLVQEKTGLELGQFMYIVFLMGLIFNALSVCAGSCVGSVLTATYVAFGLWVVTALFGGTYFDISSGSQMMQRIAMFMPQRWGMKAAEMLMDGNSFGYPMILMVTAAYLMVILVVAVLGLKVKGSED